MSATNPTCTVATAPEGIACGDLALFTWTDFGQTFGVCPDHARQGFTAPHDNSEPDDLREEISVFAAFELEAYTEETSTELFRRAVKTLREAGIRVKAASASPETSRAVQELLF